MITKKQYIILSFYMTRALFLGGGLSMLVKLSGNDVLLIGILGILLGYFILYLFFKKGSINKYISVFIALSILVVNAISNAILTSTYLLFSTPTLLIVIMFFLTLIYCSKKEFKVIGRVSEIFIIIASIEIFLAILGLTPLIKVDNMLPLFDTKLLDVIKGILVFSGASLLPNILLINYKGDLKFKDVSIGYILGSLLMVLVMFLIITIYGSQFASITRFPEFLILKKIDFLGYFSNVENILVTEWMINLLICALVCIKTLKDNLPQMLFYILILFLIFGCEIFLSRSYINILYVKKYFYYIAFILVLFSLFLKKSKTND